MEKLIEKLLDDLSHDFKIRGQNPFPNKDCLAIQKVYSSSVKESFCKDIDAYFQYIAKYASGELKEAIHKVEERHLIAKKISKPLYEWYPDYKFVASMNLNEYPDFKEEMEINDQFALSILEIITLYNTIE